MKSLIQAVTLTLVLSSTLGCEDKIERSKDTSFFNLTGPVETVVHNFDYSKKLNKSTHAQSGLKLDFNQSGALLKSLYKDIDQTNPNAKPNLSSNTFNYDENGRLQSQISNYDFNSAQKLNYLYKNDADYPYASVLISERDSQMNLLEHDEKGNLISVKSMNKDSETQTTYSATFNEENQPTLYGSSYNSDYSSTTRLTYDKNGFTSSEVRNTNDDKSVLTYEYLETDDRGNWTKRKIITEDEDGYVIENRQITYY